MMHIHGAAGEKPRRPVQSKNRKWTAGQVDLKNGHTSDGDRWERGGHRRRGRGRAGHGHTDTHLTVPADVHDDMTSATEDEGASGDSAHEDDGDQPQAEPETAEERERFFSELLRQRDIEKKKAIAEGMMDDPLVPKRLDEAITMVGTCMDMCPRFERYRREKENNLDKWEVIPGTKRVDHKRAVKIYERAAGDKTIPSDLRPPPVLKRTLDYLFHELLVKEGFSETYSFIRDRSRAVRNDFTMQHETGPLAIECHDRCARFHIIALHIEGKRAREHNDKTFSLALEEQQLMNTLQSLKEFYEDQRGRYQAPTELEMRVYHRLIHIRDQRERHEEIPDEIRNHPVFRLTTQFRLSVQAKSAPITKTSPLVVDEEGMQIFSELAAVLREQNNVVMIYLVACIMERLFGTDCIEDIESLRGDLSIPEIIDGISRPLPPIVPSADGEASMESPESLTAEITEIEEEPTPIPAPVPTAQSVPRSATEWLNTNFGAPPPAVNTSAQNAFSTQPSPFTTSVTSAKSAFSNLGSGSAFGSGTAVPSSASAPSAFGNLATAKSAFGGATFGPLPASSSAPSSFGNGSTTKSTFDSSSSSAFGPSTGASSPFASASQTARAPLTSQPTWPAESSAQPTRTQLPEVVPPQGIDLNPFASTFVPSSSAVAASPSSSSHPPPPQQPVFSSQTFKTPISFTRTPESPPKSSQPPTSADIFSIPLVSPQPSSATVASPPATPEEAPGKTPPPPAAPSDDTPSLLIERRQTLWDLPGSSSPFSRLKEEKMTFTPPPGSPAEPRTPISPTAPPPALGKVSNIALPPTPTARWFDPPSQSSESDIALSRKRSLLHFPSITLPTPGPSEILSPIHLTTPTPGKGAPAATGGPSPLYQSHAPSTDSQSTSTASSPVLAPTPKSATGPKPVLEIQTNGFAASPSSKGKAKATEADLEMKYKSFVFHSSAVQGCWNKWRSALRHTKAWEGAVSRSKQYKDQLQRSRLGASTSGSAIASQLDQTAKKRRISVPTDMATAQARRRKRRKSNQFVQPLTDEALAQRLQENYEENERRWAQGSFRQTVVDRVKKQLQPGAELPEWCMWLSMNTENDKTAIWLEHKFDVPSSGRWISETVFSIPAFKEPQAEDSPGLIVFERTPVEGVDDEIEKKYRVLDDCARLRDIISALPPAEERRYDVCLLVINWSEVEDSEKTRDLVDMTHQLVRDGVIKHVSYFNVSATAKELDKKFAALLDITPLDTEDQSSIALTWKDIKSQFVAPVESAISDLLDTCWPDDEFDWVRYDRVLSAIGEILNVALHVILGLFNDTPSHVSVEIPEDIQQPGITGRGYATGQFAEALAQLLLSSAHELVGSRFASPMVLPVDDVDAAVQKVETVISTQTDKLRQLAAEAAFRSSMGPSPKRHASQEDLRSTSSKRLRPSPSEDGVGDTDAERNGFSASPPPSTSGATDSSEKPIVTVAMLRALTREMLKTYGK